MGPPREFFLKLDSGKTEDFREFRADPQARAAPSLGSGAGHLKDFFLGLVSGNTADFKQGVQS